MGGWHNETSTHQGTASRQQQRNVAVCVAVAAAAVAAVQQQGPYTHDHSLRSAIGWWPCRLRPWLATRVLVCFPVLHRWLPLHVCTVVPSFASICPSDASSNSPLTRRPRHATTCNAPLLVLLRCQVLGKHGGVDEIPRAHHAVVLAKPAATDPRTSWLAHTHTHTHTHTHSHATFRTTVW